MVDRTVNDDAVLQIHHGIGETLVLHDATSSGSPSLTFSKLFDSFQTNNNRG